MHANGITAVSELSWKQHSEEFIVTSIQLWNGSINYAAINLGGGGGDYMYGLMSCNIPIYFFGH